MENKQCKSGDIISFVDIISILIKRIKLVICMAILGVIISLTFFVFKKNTLLYTYSYLVQAPTITTNSNISLLLDNIQLRNFLNDYSLEFARKNNTNNIQLQGLTSGLDFFKISITTEQNKPTLYQKILNDYIKQVNNMLNHKIVDQKKQAISLEKQLLKKQYSDLKELANKLQRKDSKVELSLIKIKYQTEQLNATLKSIKPLTISGTLLETQQSIGLTKSQILILGILLSIFASIITAFLVEFFINLKNSLSLKK
ncbi:hypothetical protein L3V86_07110 [Thiotrichales bacterium 19S11-10]|nr:hypothetical protein [Thiotrichales bacterium 19S11-10]